VGMRYIRVVSFDGGSPRAPDGEHNIIVVKQFTEKWEHPTPTPAVVKVLLICFCGMAFFLCLIRYV
jgi:hypothetical protein